jgi:Ariadne domain
VCNSYTSQGPALAHPSRGNRAHPGPSFSCLAVVQSGHLVDHCNVCVQALDQLFVARRILGFSYVACFYLFDGVTYADDFSPDQNSLLRNLFEDAQGMLEMEVRLPAFSERASAAAVFVHHCTTMIAAMRLQQPML